MSSGTLSRLIRRCTERPALPGPGCRYRFSWIICRGTPRWKHFCGVSHPSRERRPPYSLAALLSKTKKLRCQLSNRSSAWQTLESCRAAVLLGRNFNGRVGAWIRPVSARPSEEVSERERQYQDGSDPRVLDIVNVPLVEPRPKACQTENWLLDAEFYWEPVRRIAWAELVALADAPAILWLNTSSTRPGEYDRVALEDANRLGCSLYLLHVSSLILRVFAPGIDFGNPKRRVQAIFQYSGIEYKLWVTDPVIERTYLSKPNDTYSMSECFIVVSLGEPHDGFAYKLVATIVTPELSRS
jgi:hypothetical protein